MKIDYYTQIHKALRRCLFNFSVKTSSSDYSDMKICKENHNELLKLIDLLQSHTKHEEIFLHPLIEKKLFMAANALNKEHHTQENELLELKKTSELLITLPAALERVQQSLIFYKKLNRFITNYLQHLDEEEKLTPVLQDICTEQELLEPLQALTASFTQQEVLDSIAYMFPALNLQERLDMMHALLENSDQNTSFKIIQVAEASIPKNEWTTLKTELEHV